MEEVVVVEEERRTGLSIITQHRSPSVPSTTLTSPPLPRIISPSSLCRRRSFAVCKKERERWGG